jgi:hypothetical protein
MRKTLTTIVAVAVLMAVSAVPALAASAEVKHRETTFDVGGITKLCGTDKVEYSGFITLRSTSVVNDNGRHFRQISITKNNVHGVSTTTGQTYHWIVAERIIHHNMDSNYVSDLMFAVSSWIATGEGPLHGNWCQT